LLSLIGECCSAKEAVIGVHEAVERLGVSYNADDGGFEEVEQKVPQQAASSPVVRLSILTGLYAACELSSFRFTGKPLMTHKAEVAKQSSPGHSSTFTY
jgi:hypothetical protein